MNPEITKKFQRRFRFGKWLTLALLLFGLAVTLLHSFAEVGPWLNWLVPFNVPSLAFSHWFDPALVFVPLAVLALAAWGLLCCRQLYGRELLIFIMFVYLLLHFFLVPFYSLVFSTAWSFPFLGYLMKLSVSGVLYPIFVLIALHIWNPRRI